MNYIYGMTTLKALIELEIRALATISKYKATTYKTWQPIATKYQHLASDTCTVNENDSQFVLDLPSLPEKVIDGEYDFDLDDEPVQLILDNGMTIFDLGYCDCMTNAEFVELVRQTVGHRDFNISPIGFDSTVNLDDDTDRIKFWFDQYVNNDHTILFDDWLKDQPIRDGSDGYQVAQWLVLLFYGFLQSILLQYCLDFLDRVIQIVHDARSGIVDKYYDEIPPLTYAEDYL